MKNSADQGGCYPHRPKSEVDNTSEFCKIFSYYAKTIRGAN